MGDLLNLQIFWMVKGHCVTHPPGASSVRGSESVPVGERKHLDMQIWWRVFELKSCFSQILFTNLLTVSMSTSPLPGLSIQLTDAHNKRPL